ncbi:D-isomer specific 2-hydroxyacid dehydrogenase family protein [Bacillota bacterium Lsc_1132]
MAHKIAIVNSNSFGKRFPDQMESLQKIGEVKRFKFPADIPEKELAERLHGFDIIITSQTPKYGKEFFDHKDELLLISRHGIGYNNIDIEAATKKGTVVTNVSALVERDSVAENAVANLLAVMRHTVPAAEAAKSGRWSDRSQFVGSEISRKTAGIIGFGNIGSRVGEILKYGFNMRLLAYDPFKTKDEIESRGAEAVTLDELLSQSDVISLHALVDENSYHMLSDWEFNLMKKGVYITNAARGELLDQDAVLRALDNGTIGGLALDVVEGEPIDQTHPLCQYDNVIITPHTSAYTNESLRGMGAKVVTDVERIVNNERPDNVVN